MITKVVFGTPFQTEAVTAEVERAEAVRYFHTKPEKGGIIFTCALGPEDAVYGLGETMGHVNKRGGRYVSFNMDTAEHADSNPSLYSSHNFLILDGEKTFGVFFDTPGRIAYEVDYENSGQIRVVSESADLNVYQIEKESAYEIAREFLRAVGRCYIPPLWAFGFGQSRCGYKTQQDFQDVAEGCKNAGIPLDYICMDIDHMERFKDFSVNEKRFPDLKGFSEKMKAEGIRLVPIVDAGIKIEPGYGVYESGVKNDCFCRNREDGFFRAGVWPGMTHFPDFFRPKVREWFGQQYAFYTEKGIEGFWNDMNEPAIFYSEYTKGSKKLKFLLDMLFGDRRKEKKERALLADYRSFFHEVDGKRVCHYDVHNLYGGLMTRAGFEGLSALLDRRFLLFSRSSYIGAGRYGGLWTGDNTSCWEHLMLNLRHLPSLNMCGFLFCGADIGGFMGNCDRELLLRWLAAAIFSPLMRNHCGSFGRRQECYQFGDTADFRSIVSLRYRLLPYIYSEFMKAALTGDMYIKPLAFAFPEDKRAREIEDQLIVGGSVMMAPVVKQGETSRQVYLPEDMTMVFYDGADFVSSPAKKGVMTIEVGLNEAVFFMLKGKLMPVGKQIANTRELDWENLRFFGDGAEYLLYADDGENREYDMIWRRPGS